MEWMWIIQTANTAPGKKSIAILLMDFADADRRIILFDMSCSPSTHYYLAWIMTELGQRFERGEVPDNLFLLGDRTFTCALHMITPGNDDLFNFEQSPLRINVECAFGEVIRRWGILWEPLQMEFLKSPAVVGCCIRLQNHCIDSRIEIEEELMKAEGLVEVMPRNRTMAPYINEICVPEDNLYTMCRC